jgi:hypothetical protein
MQQAIQATGAVRNGNDPWQLPRALRLQRVRDTLAFLPTFRTALVIFTKIGRHQAPCRAAQGGEARADGPR